MIARRTVLEGIAAAAALAGLPARASVAPVERRLDGEFSAVRIELPADVVLKPAASPYARVTAASDVEPLVRIARRGDELVVDAVRSFQTRDPLRIEIGYRRLRRAEVRGAGDVAIDGPRDGALQLRVSGSADVSLAGLNLSALRVDIEGSATVTAAGAATEQTIGLKGSSTYEAKSLRSRTVVAEAHGSSEATVDVAERLVARVDGTASVRYTGPARVERQVGGTGTVERI